MNNIDLNPHPVRVDDLERPDELRIDLDPMPGVPWAQIREVAMLTREVLTEHGLVGWPKTSGSRGFHINVRIARAWGFVDVRRAALAIAREVERRAPGAATAKWWKEERGDAVFLDFNQNAKDRTVCSAYSVRPVPDARVSAPLTWDEVPACEPEAFTIPTMLRRYAERGDVGAGIDAAEGRLDALLALAEAQEADQGDAPWPPHFPKMPDEPARVSPSKKRAAGGGRRAPIKPLVIVAQSPDHAAALAGFERWKARHPDVVPFLAPHHVLDDRMRGPYTTWTRIRVNLEAVPEGLRPPQETPDPDEDPTRAWREGGAF